MNINYIPVVLAELEKSISYTASEISTWKYRTANYNNPEDYTFTSKWRQVKPGMIWGTGNTTAFFKCQGVCVPSYPADKKLGIRLIIDGEGVVKVNGCYHHGIDQNRTFIPLPAGIGADDLIDLEIEMARQFKPLNASVRQYRFHSVHFAIIDLPVESLWFDMQMAWETAANVLNDDVRSGLHNALYQACLEIDLNNASNYLSSIEKARRRLHGLLNKIDYGKASGRFHLVGHSHIDVAYLWQIKETVRKCCRTFATALTLMDEYPDYKLTVSQPQLYEYTKRYYPDIYRKIKQKVQAGQWEPTGSTWVEMDCNMPSGEALVRQFLYGKKFFQDEFDLDTRILWLPDVFGYTGSLPQIMRRAGVDYFVTCKLNLNDTNKWSLNTFLWEGIDGSRVLAHVPPSLYSGTVEPAEIIKMWNDFSQKHLVCDVLYPYGYGDGGGGVTREMLERATRGHNLPGLPELTSDTAHGYFSNLNINIDQLPVWHGELYFELHRGTYTTQAKNKRYNRKAEILYREAEIWANIAKCNFAYECSHIEISDGWKEILLQQFHDIIPGSLIHETYEDSEKSYIRINAKGERIIQSAQDAIANNVDTRLKNPVVVYNSRSWVTSDVVEVPAFPDAKQCHVVNDAGVTAPSQLSADGESLLLYVEDVPAFGYKTYGVIPGEHRGDTQPKLAKVLMHPDGHIFEVETPLIRLAFDSNNQLVSIYDIEADRTVTGSRIPADTWQMFEDLPAYYDAWEIAPYYRDKPLGVAHIDSTSLIENGPVRVVFRNNITFGESCFQRDIILYRHTKRIDFVYSGEWHEKHVLLKTAFPVNVTSTYATYEIAYGAVERTTHENTTWDQAQFEVCGHRWADLSEGDYGVSLLNDCKYGYDIKGSTMRLSHLRAPAYPDATADDGRHEFTYALYPHRGSWQAGGTVKEAYSLNQPLRAISTDKESTGRLPAENGFVKCSAENAIIETIKAAEDGSGDLVIRVYEGFGQRGPVTLSFFNNLEWAAECDLLENICEDVSYTKMGLDFYIKPYEIRTFRIKIGVQHSI